MEKRIVIEGQELNDILDVLRKCEPSHGFGYNIRTLIETLATIFERDYLVDVIYSELTGTKFIDTKKCNIITKSKQTIFFTDIINELVKLGVIEIEEKEVVINGQVKLDPRGEPAKRKAFKPKKKFTNLHG